jgi:hypothetical protein
MSHRPIVGWHEGRQSIVFLNEDGSALAGFNVGVLQKLGWFCSAEESRRTLPRLDPSPLAIR